MARKSLSKKTRFEVFKRDGFRCMYCGAHPPAAILHVDHIDPVAKGGGNDIDNLVTACQPCNAGKSDRLLADVPQTLASKAKEVRELEEQIAGYQAVLADKRHRMEEDAWKVANIWIRWHGRDSIRKDHFVSVKNFIDRLGLGECLDAMERAVSRAKGQDGSFRYFCGICWAKIREAE